MRIISRSKEIIFIGVVLLLSIAVQGGIFKCIAESNRHVKKLENKGAITIIPLNITADEKNEKVIRGSIEKFLLQRLNNKHFIAEVARKIRGISADELNRIYSSINLNEIDERLKHGDDNGYICGGNVVVLGDSVVTDFFLLDVKTGKKVVEYSSSGNNIGKVLTSADIFTAKINSGLSNSFTGELTDRVNNTEAERVNRNKNILIKSGKIAGEITSVVFSKLDESGTSYAVYAQPDKIVAMEIKGSDFAVKSEYENNKEEKIIGLTSVDTDQDGIEELVVSNVKSDNRTINSYVLTLEKGKFIKKISGLNWIFSSYGNNETQKYVFAQKHNTLNTTLDSGVFKACFEKGQLVVDDKPLVAPKWAVLPGISLNFGSGIVFGAAYRPDNRLRVFDEKGETFWESSDSFGGTNIYFSEKDESERDLDKRVWLNSPVKFADVYSDNKYNEIIAVENVDKTRSLLSRFRSFKEGRITIYSINDLTCRVAAQGEKITGYVSGFDLELNGKENEPLLFYSVVQKGKNIFSKQRSFVVVQNVNSLKRMDGN